MKHPIWFTAILLAVTLGPVGLAQNTKMKVTATGEGSGGSNMTQEQVKQLALADAKRMALEQAGTAIISETEVNNFELTKDQIHAFAQGLVKILKVSDNTCSYNDKMKAMYCKVTIDAEVEVMEGKELFAKLAQSRSQERHSTAQGELSFGFNVLAFRPEMGGSRGVKIKSDSNQTYQHVELQENSVLRSGDEFQIRFTPMQDAYVYVINVDTQGQVYAMLPNAEGITDNHLKAGRSYILPADGKYYQLDNNTGIETIYLVAARQTMPDIEYLLNKNGDQVAALLNATVKTRGISGITSGSKTSYPVGQTSVQDVEEVIKGKGAVVRVFKFQHQ